MSLTGWLKEWQRGWGSRTGRAAKGCSRVLRPGSSHPTTQISLVGTSDELKFLQLARSCLTTTSISLGHEIHAKDTVDLMGSGLISTFFTIDFPIRFEEEQSPPLSIHLLNTASSPCSSFDQSPLRHLYNVWNSWTVAYSDPFVNSVSIHLFTY